MLLRWTTIPLALLIGACAPVVVQSGSQAAIVASRVRLETPLNGYVNVSGDPGAIVGADVVRVTATSRAAGWSVSRQDLVQALGSFSLQAGDPTHKVVSGDLITVEALRGGQVVTAPATFTAY